MATVAVVAVAFAAVAVNRAAHLRTNFSLPYSDNFDAVRDDHAPRFTSDMHGVFTAVDEPRIGGKILQQQTASRPVSTAGGGDIYATIIGDGSIKVVLKPQHEKKLILNPGVAKEY